MSVYVQGVEIFTNPTIQGTVGAGTGLTMPSFNQENADTTFSRGAAGIVAVEGVNLVNLSAAQVLTNKTLTAPAINGIVTTTGLTMPPFQLSAAAGIGRAVDTNFLNLIGGTDDHSARLILWGKSSGTPGAFQFQTPNAALSGTTRLILTGAADTVSATWSSLYHIGMKFGLAGTATGAWTMDGATSGVVTMTVAAAAGNWAMTLPTTGGTNGYSLTTDGAGVTTWTNIASLLEFKNLLPEDQWLKPQDALDRLLGTRVAAFNFKPGMGTGDALTRYDGIVANADWPGAAPWATHYDGGVFNPINAFGNTVLAIQAMNEVGWLKDKVREAMADAGFKDWLKRELIGV